MPLATIPSKMKNGDIQILAQTVESRYLNMENSACMERQNHSHP